MHVHFVGMNGSGISGVACAAKQKGLTVTGCDREATGNYTMQLSANDLVPIVGHDPSHLEGVDIVATSPALLYRDRYKDVPELLEAKKRGILMKWQEFLGTHIFDDGNTIAVCGTHGKTTTTSLLGLVMEHGGLDPSVFVGGVVGNWGTSFRVGQSDWYAVEADEYDYNFMHYNPKFVILNNLEMEHPEIFRSVEEYTKTFRDFLMTLREGGMMICNLDDEGVQEIMAEMQDELRQKNIRFIGYSTQKNPADAQNYDAVYHATDIVIGHETMFSCEDMRYRLPLMGRHNVMNAMAVISLAREIGLEEQRIAEALEGFEGSRRRLECIFENNTLCLYNDYAHHHTQVKATVNALKEGCGCDVIAILEPHQVSRITNHADEYFEALSGAKHFIVTEIFKGREEHHATPDMKQMIADTSVLNGHYIPDHDKVLQKVESLIEQAEGNHTCVVVMGAGRSYKLANQLQALFEARYAAPSSKAHCAC